jgi:hypothetical protein
MYRLRATANWSGVTTLPSRSYIAPFLAMGALAGAGWIAGAAWNRRGARLIAGLTGMGLVIAAMVMSASRTAALTLVAGATFFVVLVVLRICERRTVAVVALATMIALGLGLVVRFAWFDGGEITSLMRPRMPLWRDALALWKDAPLFGHGINTFSYLLPLYATSGVNHPAVVPPFESGWLQWLAELGAVPWLLVLTVFIAFFSRHVRESFHASSGFFVRAGAAGAVLVAIAHGIIDGSSERWATSAFALAALAIACPFASDGEQTERSAKPAVIAVGTAVFWMLPLMFDLPAWSPLAAARLLARDAAGGKASAHELARAVEAFPLDARLHQALGMHQLSDRHAPVRDWMRHFQIASRLTPGSWIVPYAQARACHDIAPEQARQYWQQAIECGGEQREDLFMRALRETAGDAGAEKFWHDYAGAHPELILLTLAQLPEPARRERFAFWWNQRASGHETFGPNERRLLQLYLPQYGTPEHLEAWMRLRSAWRASEWSDWVRILHGWNEDARAWQIAQSMVADPPFPSTNAALLRDQLLLRWRNDKNDFVNARLLAAALDSEGDAAAASKVILETAERPDAPLWFVQKAAHLLANAGSFRAAVALILRERD